MTSTDRENVQNFYRNLIAEQRQRAADLGWHEIDAGGYRDVWDRFDAQFRFRPSIDPGDWPSIEEPVGSVTYSLEWPKSKSIEEYQEWLETLKQHYLLCFRSLDNTSNVLALDWQHDCFRISDISAMDEIPHDEWPITPFPNGDYYIFMTESFSHGFFGHPWESSICVFGGKFVTQTIENPPDIFGELIRDNR